MDESQLLEKMYFYELERKQQLEKSTSLPTGVIVACFGLLGYFFTNYRFGGAQNYLAPVVESAFSIFSLISLLLFISLLLLCTTTYWCSRTIAGSAYEYLPGAETLRAYRQDLVNWHKQYRTRTPLKAAATEFQDYLTASLARCSQQNWQTNLVRSEELFRTKRFTVISIVGLAATASTFYNDFWFEAPKLPLH